MDLEPSFQVINTAEVPDGFGTVAYSSYTWRNAGGDPDATMIAVQTGTTISFFDSTVVGPLSGGFVVSFPGVASKYHKCSYAVVDGLLVIATGQKLIQVFEIVDGAIVRSEQILYVRDQFGVEDVDPSTGFDLTESNNISLRPSVLTQAHTYNLRNQTWGVSRRSGQDGDVRDLITYFYDSGPKVAREELYPSNADNVNTSLYAKTSSEDDAITPRFWPKTAIVDAISSSPAPRGYFIIDALERGKSRLEVVENNSNQYKELGNPVTVLPEDATPDGAAVVSEFSGRIFFGGFSGELTGGDKKSPRLSSYVLFSNRVRDTSDINKCYQIGDPTSRDVSDILATDGGFIRVDGAFNIISLTAISRFLIVIAENGVWSIAGGSDYGFAADNYSVSKISEHGSIAPNSIAVVDNSLVYWADDGIYSIAPNQVGTLQATNLTAETIQTLYDNIPVSSKIIANGIYDSYERKIRWLYPLVSGDVVYGRELIFDVTLQAFYTATVRNGDLFAPAIVACVEVPPFTITSVSNAVVVGGDPVVADSDPVVYTKAVKQPGQREVAYIALLSLSPVTYTFSYYRDPNFEDWSSAGFARDAPAFMLTGYISGGNIQKDKQVPYVTFFLERTEDGFEEDGLGNLNPTNESSCLVQAQWNWTNSANSNRWGRQFQAYRYKRLYMPSGSGDSYNTGDLLISTKNKLRGSGKVLSMLIKTEPRKDCRLKGWAMEWGIMTDD